MKRSHLSPRLERLSEKIIPAVTASFSGGILTITGDSAANRIILEIDADGDILLNDDSVAGDPTVFNTDNISVRAGGGKDFIQIDQRNGTFGPGLTAETTGESEIEFVIDGGGGMDALQVFAPHVVDRIEVGSKGFNLNQDDDVDVTLTAMEKFLVILGDAGGVIDASGSPATGDAFPLGVYLEGSIDFVACTLIGGAGNDTLAPGFGDNSLSAGAGDDEFLVLFGNHTIDGGPGQDRLLFNPALVTEEDVRLTLTDTLFVSFGTSELISVERASLEGSLGHDLLDATAFSGPVTLYGGILGGDTLLGGAGADVLRGSFGPDVLCGGAGSDKLVGRSGNDSLTGGDGKDTLLSGFGRDTLLGLTGGDFLNGGPDSDSLDGGVGRDTCLNAETKRNCEL